MRRRLLILEHIEMHPNSTVRDVHDHMGGNPRSIRNILNALTNTGHVHRTSDAGAYRYARTSKPAPTIEPSRRLQDHHHNLEQRTLDLLTLYPCLTAELTARSLAIPYHEALGALERLTARNVLTAVRPEAGPSVFKRPE